MNILVVDDMGINVQIVSGMIKAYTERNSISANIIKTLDSKFAKKIIEEEDINVLVTDYFMPNVNGIELIDHAKKHGVDRNILLSSTYVEEMIGYEHIRREDFDASIIFNTSADYKINKIDESIHKLNDSIKNLSNLSKLFELTLELSPMMVSVKDKNDKFVYISENAIEAFPIAKEKGLSYSDFIGCTVSEVADKFPEIDNICDLATIIKETDNFAKDRDGPITFIESVTFEGNLNGVWLKVHKIPLRKYGTYYGMSSMTEIISERCAKDMLKTALELPTQKVERIKVNQFAIEENGYDKENVNLKEKKEEGDAI